jgi:hypothetical protein
MPEASTQNKDMTDEEIRGVFETLRLPVEPRPLPSPGKQAGPVIFFPISGNSPPLDPRYQ